MGFPTIKIKKIEDSEDRAVFEYGLWEITDGILIHDKKAHYIDIGKLCKEDEEYEKPIFAEKAAIKIASGRLYGTTENELYIRTG